MNRAEERANEAYPFKEGDIVYDEERVKEAQGYYIEGYKQAEKDNAPTWEDIESIISIANDFLNTFDYDKVKAMGREGYYGEILKRWKERKKA